PRHDCCTAMGQELHQESSVPANLLPKHELRGGRRRSEAGRRSVRGLSDRKILSCSHRRCARLKTSGCRQAWVWCLVYGVVGSRPD
ncbi:hypothetical protein B0A49_14035, partial [Cryomyces minteri]